MKIQIPPSEYPIFKIEATGPDFFRMVEASTELSEVELDLEDNDERDLTLTGQYYDRGRNPVGSEIVLKVADDSRYDEDDAANILSESTDPEDEDDEEAPVEDREEAPVEEADELVEEPLDE